MNEILPFGLTLMGLETVRLSEMSVREKQLPYDLNHMWNLRNKTNEQRQRQTKKQILNYGEKTDGYQRVGGGEWNG